MALDTLKDVTEIDGFPVKRFGMVYEENTSICIDDESNTIVFQIQNGPTKENEVNGCQVDTIIETAKIMLEGLNEKIPCERNKEAIEYLNMAMSKLKMRKADRERRGVEGTSNA